MHNCSFYIRFLYLDIVFAVLAILVDLVKIMCDVLLSNIFISHSHTYNSYMHTYTHKIHPYNTLSTFTQCYTTYTNHAHEHFHTLNTLLYTKYIKKTRGLDLSDNIILASNPKHSMGNNIGHVRSELTLYSCMPLK